MDLFSGKADGFIEKKYKGKKVHIRNFHDSKFHFLYKKIFINNYKEKRMICFFFFMSKKKLIVSSNEKERKQKINQKNKYYFLRKKIIVLTIVKFTKNLRSMKIKKKKK